MPHSTFMKLVVLVTFVHGILSPASAQDSNAGRFVGELILKDIKSASDDTAFELAEEFTYVDNNSRVWTAPKGVSVNGASIPKYLRLFVGDPWSKQYRKASVIHDHFCETMSREWKDVHKLFYDALITSGVNKDWAKWMYFAVYRFGPRWTNTEKNYISCVAKFKKGQDTSVYDAIYARACDFGEHVSGRLLWTPEFDRQELEDVKQAILNGELPLDEILAIADRNALTKAKSKLPPWRQTEADFVSPPPKTPNWVTKLDREAWSAMRELGMVR